MKKFLAIALIAASFTACNEGEKKVEETPAAADSATATPATPAPATTDSATATVTDTAKAATPAPAAADTTKK